MGEENFHLWLFPLKYKLETGELKVEEKLPKLQE